MNQCHGIAKALQKIHHIRSNSFPQINIAGNNTQEQVQLGVLSNVETRDNDAKDWGRHGDIKPENLLWFSDSDNAGNDDYSRHRLVISDFGLSRYHSYQSKSKDPNENLEGYTPTYRPPECDMRCTITPRYDVWASRLRLPRVPILVHARPHLYIQDIRQRANP